MVGVVWGMAVNSCMSRAVLFTLQCRMCRRMAFPGVPRSVDACLSRFVQAVVGRLHFGFRCSDVTGIV